MATRKEILAELKGTIPFAFTLDEAAAFCGMSREYFQGHCKVVPVKRGHRRLYPSEDVRQWFRRWYLAESGQNPLEKPTADWTELFDEEEDNKDAA
jgi:hypothetical protein